MSNLNNIFSKKQKTNDNNESDDENEDLSNETNNLDNNNDDYAESEIAIPLIDYETLFALRVSLQDEYDDEYNIIIELKNYLYNNNISIEETNSLLTNFYNHYGINTEMLNIENIILPQYSNINNIFNEFINQTIHHITENVNENNNEQIFILDNFIHHNSLNNEDDNIEINNEDNNEDNNQYNNEEYNNFYQLLNNINTINTNDVICTLNKDHINKLNKYILTKNLNKDCNICLDNIIINQEVIELNCNHIFHSNCILEYLKKYNYKCPICKTEQGTPDYTI